jgi:hypothetical protein
VPPDCPVCQRSNGSLRANSRLQIAIVLNSAAHKSERRSQKLPDYPVQHRTVQCSKTTSASNGQLPQTLTVALTWHAPDCEQWLSGAPPDCPVRPSPATARKWLGAINTPQPPHSKPSKPSKIFIYCKSKVQHSKTQSKLGIHSKVPKINASA